MLEHRRRSQLRLEPIGAMPSTRTTTTRRTRRLCLNIETNGAGPTRLRRRRKSALRCPYFMTYPPVYEANPWICGDWGSNENFYSYGNFVNPVNRLYAGEEYEYAPVNEFIPPEEEYPPNWYDNNSGQKAAGDLKNILMTLESYLQYENNMEPKNNLEPDPTGVPEDENPQNNHLSVTLDLICDTIGRLNNYMTAMSNNNEQMDVHQMTAPSPPPVQVLQLPVQPLILPPLITNPTMFSSNYPYVMEPEPCPTEGKSLFQRLPWLKERKRKRSSKSSTHVQSQSCSTEDLDRLPRILKASSDIPTKFFTPNMRDSGTTMWCSMKCCKDYCGSVWTQTQEMPAEDFETPPPMTIRILSPITITDHFPSSVLRAPPPSMKSEDDMEMEAMDLRHPPSKSNYPVVASSSALSTSYEYHRHTGGNLLYSYVAKGKEEQLQVELEEEHVDDDEWYLGASHKLAELEMEQEFFKELQMQSQVITRDQQQQTDLEIDNNDSLVNIRVTTDKAVSTTDIGALTNQEPVKIVRTYKRSSLKSRQRLPSSNQRGKTKGCQKVKFEKEQ
ncbi:hypothetical protein KR038_004082, partial [Drosophila bunnanda]